MKDSSKANFWAFLLIVAFVVIMVVLAMNIPVSGGLLNSPGR